MKRDGQLRRTPMPPCGTPLPVGKPLSRSKALRRTALLRTVRLARAAVPARRPKTRVGEFSPRVRKLLWTRFQGRCAACGDPLPPKYWTAQHRRARGAGGTSDPAATSPANGVAVHEIPCHRLIEDQPTQALYDGFRIPQSADPAKWPIRIWDGRFLYLTSSGGYADEPEES